MKDTIDTLKCPACGMDMEKVYMEEQKFNVDVCLKGCGGMFLDNLEYKKLYQAKDDITPILNATKGKNYTPVNSDRIKYCPMCGGKLIKNFSSHLRTIKVEECYNCGGKFLEAGVLEAIRNEFPSEKERKEDFNKFFRATPAGMQLEKDKADKEKKRK